MADQGPSKDDKQGHVNPAFSSHQDDKTLPHQSQTLSEGDVADDEKVVLYFGLGPLKSAWVGKYLCNLYLFALFVGCAAMLPAAGIKSISINLQSLKTQFKLTDTEATDMQIANSVGIAVSSILSGYIGSFHKTHIPILTGIAALLNGIALMVPSFLQFSHPYHMHINFSTANDIFRPFLCTILPPNFVMSNDTGMGPEPPRSDHMVAYGVLLFSHAMSGFLLPMVTVLAPIYMDNNETNKSKLGIFMGIYTLCVECASFAGLSVSGFLAINPVDFKETKLNPKDQRFVGAWWLPLLLFGACLCLVGLYIMQFPKRLISKRQQRRALAEAALSFAALNDEVDTHASDNTSRVSAENKAAKRSKAIDTLITAHPDISGGGEHDVYATPSNRADKRPSMANSIVYDSIAIPRQGIVGGISDFPMQIYRVMKNPVFALFMIDAALLAIPLKGSELFRPYYQIFQYSIGIDSIASANIGFFVANILGVVAGAAVCWKTRTLKGYALTILICFGLCSLIAPVYFAVGCDNQKLYGYTGKYGVPLPNTTMECLCYPLALPTCGDDGRSYFSPCYAGCLAGDGFTFQNCSRQSTLDHGQGATTMMCDAGCFNHFIGYSIVLSILIFLTQMTVVSRTLLIIRVVEPRDRAFGTSVFIFFFALFSIPASKVSGHMFEDIGCMIHTGTNCVLYDRAKIRYLMSGMELIVYVILFFTAWIMFLIFKMMNRKVAWKREGLPQNQIKGTNSEKL